MDGGWAWQDIRPPHRWRAPAWRAALSTLLAPPPAAGSVPARNVQVRRGERPATRRPRVARGRLRRLRPRAPLGSGGWPGACGAGRLEGRAATGSERQRGRARPASERSPASAGRGERSGGASPGQDPPRGELRWFQAGTGEAAGGAGWLRAWASFAERIFEIPGSSIVTP